MGKFAGEVFFSNGRVEAITRFKRYSYFPNRIFFSTNSGNYCMNSEVGLNVPKYSISKIG